MSNESFKPCLIILVNLPGVLIVGQDGAEATVETWVGVAGVLDLTELAVESVRATASALAVGVLANTAILTRDCSAAVGNCGLTLRAGESTRTGACADLTIGRWVARTAIVASEC
jgi:hypothetical protein